MRTDVHYTSFAPKSQTRLKITHSKHLKMSKNSNSKKIASLNEARNQEMIFYEVHKSLSN